jgi:hypothetical protein
MQLRTLLVVIAVCCVAPPLTGQVLRLGADARSLRGVTVDTTGRPMARVVLSHGAVQTVSDSLGRFTLEPLPAGTLLINLARDGVLLTQATVPTDSTTTSPVELEVVSASEAGSLTVYVQDTDGDPVSGATAEVLGYVEKMTTDAVGQFRTRGLPDGRYLIRVRRLGMAPVFEFVTVMSGASAELTFVMEKVTAQMLERVEVRAQAGSRGALGFYERMRRRTGFGHFITPEQVQARKPIYASDLLYTVPGITVQRTRSGATMILGRGGCQMGIVLNGMSVPPMDGFGLDEVVAGSEIIGVEVYPGFSGIPTDLMVGDQRNSCGIVSVWTR